MKKRDLEIRLESVRKFNEPDPLLEQYPTPSVIASDILFTAYSEGDVHGKKVNDLGCGTGIFSIGSWLLGGDVEGFDISEKAVAVAKANASEFNADIPFTVCDVRDVTRKADTTIMNPPFGSQNKHADRPFLEKATETSESIYSIHMEKTLPFIEEYVKSMGKEVVYRKTYKYHIPHTFSFHSKTEQNVNVIMVIIR